MARVPGSDTVLATGVVVAKHVGEVPQNVPATWMFPSVIPVETSALLSTKNSELVVALPVLSRQIVSVPTPPHATPIASENPPLTSLTAVSIPFSFTSPENPITGPPSRTEPDVIWMSTQTEVLEKLMQLPVPPWVKLTVPISVPLTDISSVMLVAEAAGTVASVAAMISTKIEGLLLRMAVLLCRSVRHVSGAAGVARYLGSWPTFPAVGGEWFIENVD
jgi:hypothetical protein